MIEKEWVYFSFIYYLFLFLSLITFSAQLAFGHKFADRAGHADGQKMTSSEKSPVFIQFLVCISVLGINFLLTLFAI